MDELLIIPEQQFEDYISSNDKETIADYYAIRLIIALLKQGRSQFHSPDSFCELSDTVNAEFADYINLALSSKLGLITPDRLDDIYNGDINELCKDAWDNFNRPMEIGFLQSVKFSLLRLIKG